MPHTTDINDWFQQLLEPSPRLHHHAQRNTARLLTTIILGLIAILSAMLLLHLVIPGSRSLMILITVSWAALIGLYIVSRSVYYRAGIWMLLGGTLVIILAAVGLTEPNAFTLCTLLSYLNLAVLFSSLLLTLGWTLGIASLSLLLAAGIVLAVQLEPDAALTILGFNLVISAFIVNVAYIRQRDRRHIALQARELEESETRYHTLFEALADPVCVHDNGIIRDVNPAFEQVFGYPRSEIIGMDAWEYLSDETREFLQGHDLQEPDHFEGTLHKRDGSLVHAEMSSRPVIHAGVPLRVTCVRDITARKQAEAALEAERNLLRTVIDNIPHRIFVKDTDARFILVNREVVRWERRESEHDLLGKTDFDLDEAQVAQHYFDEEKAIFATGQPVINRIIDDTDKFGQPYWTASTKVPLRDSSGNITGILGINRDITEQRQAELKLQDERNLLRNVIDNIPDRIYVKDADYRFVLTNQAVAARWPQYDGNIIGKSDADLYPETEAQAYQEIEARVLAGEPLVDIDDQWVDPTGQQHWSLTSKFPLYNREGHITGIIGVHRDVTEVHKAEAQVEAERNLLRTVIDNMPDHIYLKDADHRFVLANRALTEVWQCDLIGKSDYDLFTTDHARADRFIAEEKRIMDSGQALINVESYSPPEVGAVNKPEWILRSKIPVRDHTGKVTGILGINRDVTARKEAELKLEEERNLLRIVIDNIPESIYVKDTSSRFILANQSVIDIYQDVDIIGKTDHELTDSVAADEFRAEELRIFQSGEAIHDHEHYVPPDHNNLTNEPVWLLINKIPLRDANGRITGLVGINRDITETKLAKLKLEEERNLLRTLIDNVPDHIFIKDRDGRFLLANRATQNRWNRDLIGDTDFDLMPPEVAERNRADEERLLATGIPINDKEVEAYDRNGSLQWLLSTKVPLYDHAGNITGLMGINRYITDLKKSQLALNRERNLLRAVIESVPDHIYVKDPQGCFILANPAVLKYHNLPNESAILGKTDYDLFADDEARAYHELDDHILQQAEPIFQQEYEYQDESGGTNWYVITKIPLRDASGQPFGLLGVDRDITPQKRAEQAVREERNLLRAVIDNVPDQIYVKDRDGAFILINEAVQKHWGKSVLGLTDLELVTHTDPWPIYEAEQNLMATGTVSIGREAPGVSHTGEQLWHSITKVPLRDSQGKVIGLVGFNRNITELKRAEDQLRHDSNLLRAVIDNLPDHIYMKDRDHRFILVNNTCIRRWGKDIVGLTDYDLQPENDVIQIFRDEDRIFETGEPSLNKPVYGIDVEGKPLWFSITKVPVYDADGKISALVGINRNISELKRTENELRSERNLLRNVIDNLPDQIYVKDRQHRLLLVNKTVADRWKGIELTGKTDQDLHTPENAARYMTEEQQIFESEQPMLNDEQEIMLLDGRRVWMSITKLPLRNLDGEIIGLIGISHDITARKRFEEHLRYHAELLEKISDAVISTDTSFTILSWNRGAERLYGWQADEVIGKRVGEVIPAQFVDQPETTDTSAATLFANGQWIGEVLHPHRHGDLLHIYNITTLIRNDEGQPTGVVGVNRDITEQKRAEQQRLELTVERERVGILRQVISDMSHDLKNPLANMRTSLYLLSRFADNPTKRQSYIETLDALTVRIETMLDDLLMMSRLEQSNDEFEFSAVRLDELLRDIVQEQQSLADQREQRLELGDIEANASIHADYSKLRRAVTNLVVNALNYTPEGGEVHITCQRADTGYVIDVQDNGIGISPDEQPKIFERFYRADKARSSRTGGSGLGLPIAKRIIEAHGGQITVTSTPDAGSTFTLQLPLTPADHDIS